LSLSLLAGLALLCTASVAPVVALRWVDPPTSSVIVQHRLLAWWRGEPRPFVHHEWVPWAQIPKGMALAVVAAEDQRFPDHAGFDFVQMRRAWEDYQAGGRLRGASTLSQQVAKNLFLWHGRSGVRKGLEAWFTLLLEGLLTKTRILEIYLNIAQFGPDTYGVGAASRRFFSRPVATLTTREAAQLAAVLPNPERYSVNRPSPHVQRRVAWILAQMERLGGVRYLERL
jgi:monofunctional biosynthetic peptidoglycan transglycosylase